MVEMGGVGFLGHAPSHKFVLFIFRFSFSLWGTLSSTGLSSGKENQVVLSVVFVLFPVSSHLASIGTRSSSLISWSVCGDA